MKQVNDGQVAFPEVMLESGSSDYPVSMSGCRQVAQNVYGNSSDWSEVGFNEPVSCGSQGLYVLFRFPEGSEQEGEGAGGGAAFGFVEGGGHEGWMSADGEYWVKVDQAFGFAVQPVFVDSESGMIHMNGIVAGPEMIGVVESSPDLKTGLQPVSPNPFNPATEIRFTLEKTEQVVVSVFDVRGRKIIDLVDEVYSQGRHSVTWQGRNQDGLRVSSGVYFARLQLVGDSFTRRMLLVK